MVATRTSLDYHLTFKTHEVPLFFADICSRFYLPIDGVIYQHKNQYKQFIDKNYIVKAKENYNLLYKNAMAIESFCTEFDQAKTNFLKLGKQLENIEIVNVIDFNNLINEVAKIERLYGNFDPIYTDLLFIDSERDTEELKKLVLQKKNQQREDLNKLFFNQSSLLVTILKIVGKQTSNSLENILSLPINSSISLLSGETFFDKYQGNNDYVIIRVDNKFEYLFGDKATEFIKSFESSDDITTGELIGTSVSKKGLYRGIVKKIQIGYGDLENSLKTIDYSGEGFILVAETTIPEFVTLMSKAKAIVTDVGGLLSHAAITARELNLPCIIGTKIATKVLQNGDMVEVDADTGIIRVLNRE